jgi:hypothetical protein
VRHVVKALPYHRKGHVAALQAGYISHGDRAVPDADRAEVYGIGDRYKDLSRSIADPAERAEALQNLIAQDAGRLSKPTYHHHIFTVDDRAAKLLARMNRPEAEQRLRSALSQSYNASAAGRQMQGMYAIHWDGGAKRSAHPHVHVIYSPLRRDGQALYIGPNELAKLKLGWNRAIDRTIELSPTRTRRPLASLALDAGGHGRQALRVARDAQAFVRNPGRATLEMAFRAVSREVFRAVGRGPYPALSPAATLAAQTAGAVLKVPLAKVAIPVMVVRNVFGRALDLGRER